VFYFSIVKTLVGAVKIQDRHLEGLGQYLEVLDFYVEEWFSDFSPFVSLGDPHIKDDGDQKKIIIIKKYYYINNNNK
jgi:hypothetical protein